MTIRPRLILCAVDFSDDARRALEHAVALAALHHAQLVVHTAIDPLLAQAAASAAQDYVRETRAELAHFIGRPALHQVAWAPFPRLVVTVGDAPAQILEVAAFYHADLIVLGAQGLGGVARPVIGSTVDEVLRRTATPVLVIPHGGRPTFAFTKRGPRFEPRPVLAAVDLRDASHAVAGAAAELSGLLDAPLLLAHAVLPVEAPARWSACSADATRVHTGVAEIGLGALAAGLMTTAEHVVVTGHPSDAIVSLAAERRAGLIVMGSGASHDGSPRFGSTAYRVLSFTTVPVLVLPPDSEGAVHEVGWSTWKEVIA